MPYDYYCACISFKWSWMGKSETIKETKQVGSYSSKSKREMIDELGWSFLNEVRTCLLKAA